MFRKKKEKKIERRTIVQEEHAKRKLAFKGIDLSQFIFQSLEKGIKLGKLLRSITDQRNFPEKISDRFWHKICRSKIQAQFWRNRTHFSKTQNFSLIPFLGNLILFLLLYVYVYVGLSDNGCCS